MATSVIHPTGECFVSWGSSKPATKEPAAPAVKSNPIRASLVEMNSSIGKVSQRQTRCSLQGSEAIPR